MRRILLIIAVFFTLWLVYMASPYYALYDLAKAVQARDTASLNERIDFAEVRRGIAGQIAQALRGNRGDGPLGQATTRGIQGAIDPLLEPYVTPEAITRLLTGSGAAGDGEPAPGLGSAVDIFASLDRAWLYFRESEFRGFRAFRADIPPEKPYGQRFRIIMRLTSATWRVVGIELPVEVRDRIVQSAKLGRPAPE